MPLIRPASPRDIDGIFTIYDREVLHGTATFETTPKSPSQRQEWFEAHAPDKHPLLVAVDSDRVLGWAGLSPWSPRQAYARTAENSVYVHHEFFGQGIGTSLMRELISMCVPRGIFLVIARIGGDNPASIALHRRLGFTDLCIMRRVGEKFGRVLDVRMMALNLD